MSRAVLVSAGGDPFLTMFVYQLFKKYWYSEVDHMYICFNTEMDDKNLFTSEILSRLAQDKKISIIYNPYRLGWGEPIRRLVLTAKEELVMLLEDDGFIFQPGIVDEYFKAIEDGKADVVGSARYSVGEVADAAKKKFNLNYEGFGDRGFGWWPNFFFCKREDLLKTDLSFGSTVYKKGVYVKELDHTFSEECYTDTFTWTSIQLRYLGVKALEIPQYHASPNEGDEYLQKIGKWEKRPPYIHGGSLSSGWSINGFLLGRHPIPDAINGLHEIETRAAFWMLASDMVDGFTEFKKEYKQGIENLINNAKLDRGLIRQKYNIYKSTIGL